MNSFKKGHEGELDHRQGQRKARGHRGYRRLGRQQVLLPLLALQEVSVLRRLAQQAQPGDRRQRWSSHCREQEEVQVMSDPNRILQSKNELASCNKTLLLWNKD